MARVIFWEKPGCAGNARQKALLKASGHTLDVRSILDEAWDGERIRSFFGARPVAEWFNVSSPRVKSGEIVPATLEPEEAIALMLADHLLIRRPLMEVDGRREAGFDAERVRAWIGLIYTAAPVTDTCVQETARAAGKPEPDCSTPD
ncbi:nitrogenase-associated protein [Rhodomicrobium vannielii ATCC 17100]|uniref:Nitrogenase-associated protein n=1 Tax=Rhodomicrobium vannielii (strain ATCC 17100 / DSM 162 / LMG 4299 / NCIMB 10020 / ATH 3.1.1) TaxID=648757 RepID=E3I0U4_RHOVT|nr:ArsC/Spx/MgsR family protein [Rhodomicrobium vannielii]ADP71184.1 nitrogenase-associated protein [Rhodomicrobium vannielii ATCC 17100]